MFDRDILESEWNQYLKKYTNDYVLDRNQIGIWCIRLKKKLGWIEPYSIVNSKLNAVLTFKSQQHKTFWKKNLTKMRGFDLQITQESKDELCLVFNEKDLKALDSLFCYYRRKKLSDAQRHQLSKRAKRLSFSI